MRKLFSRAPAFLSFFLPGLGQLSQKQYVLAVGFFLVFAVCVASQASMWGLVPVIALISGLETLRRPDVAITDPRLKSAYGLVGGIGFLFWMVFVASFFYSVPKLPMTQEEDQMAAVYQKCSAGQKLAPLIVECVQKELPSDPWGEPYQVGFSDLVFEIRSFGPDKQPATADDRVFQKRLGLRKNP